MGAKFFGEFMGTLVLILLGNGVVANVSLRHSKAEGAGWTAIAAGWAFAVMAGSFTATACGSPDSHLNPAMTLGMAIVSGDFSKVLPFLAAQLLGAVAGAIAVWLHFLPHWKVTDDANLKLACFSTSPAIPNFGANLLSEIIGTFVLVTVVRSYLLREGRGGSGRRTWYGPKRCGDMGNWLVAGWNHWIRDQSCPRLGSENRACHVAARQEGGIELGVRCDSSRRTIARRHAGRHFRARGAFLKPHL